jgi:hypothetical protein
VKGAGGTEGGIGRFTIGLVLAVVAVYLFFDSVRVSTAHYGWISGLMHRSGGRGLWETTSMGIVFAPFFIGVIALFYDAKMKWAWWLTYLGIAILAVEILSRIRFLLESKLTHLLMMIVLFAAGVGLMLRSYREKKTQSQRETGQE